MSRSLAWGNPAHVLAVFAPAPPFLGASHTGLIGGVVADIGYYKISDGKDDKFPSPGACRTMLVTGEEVGEYNSGFYSMDNKPHPADYYPCGKYNTVAFMSLRTDSKPDVIADALAHGWVEIARWIGAHCEQADEIGAEYWMVLLARAAKPEWLKVPTQEAAAPKKIARGAKTTLQAKLLRKRKGSK